jgi:DNA helicase-2/ATP-dependent DNA helicase PcrA
MLAELLPCRIVGDPLQGIFDFDGGIDWSKEVQPCFPLLHRLDKPWRWQKNPQLGEWLQEARMLLATGREIDLSTGPISWETHEHRTALNKCLYLPVNSGESVVALMGKVENQSRAFAAKLKGRFTHMEVVECKPLLDAARKLDCVDGPGRAAIVIDFACTCMSGVKSVLKKARDAFVKDRIPKVSSRNKNGKVIEALIDLAQDRSEEAVLQAAKRIEALPDRVIHSRELWQEFKSVLREGAVAKTSLAEVARKKRERTRYMGRRVDPRTVSRTLLVKGLEFDHAVILNASSKDFDAKNFYVAITRASKSLTVLSDSPKITKPAPNIIPQFL